MKNNKALSVIVISLMLIFSTLLYSSNGNTSRYKNTFDKYTNGQLPEGWIVDATRRPGWFNSKDKTEKLASWNIQRNNSNTDSNTDSNNMLAITAINHSSRSTFNIIYTDNIKFKNGEVRVKVQAKSGVVDQGGGPIWRVKDNNNYYIARYNPLERNFRVYYVKDGVRVKLKSARNINLKQGEWFDIKIKHKDDHIEGWLNGKKLLDVKDDTLKGNGGVGLWTKADAMTSFDDFRVSTN